MKHAKTDRLTNRAGLLLTPALLILVVGELVLGGLLLAGEAERQLGLQGAALTAETSGQAVPAISLAVGGGLLLLVCVQGRRMLSRAALKADAAAASSRGGAMADDSWLSQTGPGLHILGPHPSHQAPARPISSKFANASKIHDQGTRGASSPNRLYNNGIDADIAI